MTYRATFRELNLELEDDGGAWRWRVTDASGTAVAEGRSDVKETAMIAASEAAQADWGTVRWRRPGDE